MDKVINILSRKLADYLVKNNKIGTDKQELYEYISLVTIQSAINIFATLFLGLILGEFFQNICFFIVFKILRKYSGGLHSSKFSTCFLISVISNIAIIIAIKILEVYPNYCIAIILEIISFLIVIVFAPVVNVNKPITKKELRIYRLIVCILSVILIGVSMALFNKCSFIFAISLAMLLNSVLIIVEILKLRCFDKMRSL